MQAEVPVVVIVAKIDFLNIRGEESALIDVAVPRLLLLRRSRHLNRRCRVVIAVAYVVSEKETLIVVLIQV